MSDLSAIVRARGASLLGRLSRRGQVRSPAARWAVLGLAVALFVGSAWYAVHSLSGVPLGPGWAWWLGLAAALSLVTFTVNAGEFAVSARLLHVRAGALDSFRVSILGSAANIMPVPGAAIVRSAALKRLGLGYRAAVSVTAVIGVAWVAMSCLVAGVLLVPAGETVLGGLALVAGLGGLAASFGLLVTQRSFKEAARSYPLVIAVELTSVGVGVVRTWTVLQALGADASLAEASVFTVAATVASAAGLLPGGLGLREALSAAVGAAVGFPAAIGLLVAAVDRVVGYVVLGLCSAVVLLLTPGAARRAGRDADEAPAALVDQPGPT
jgi:hypothetical protein